MTSSPVARPVELKIALFLASASVLLGFATVFALRQQVEAGWGFILFLRFIVLAIYAVILTLAYQGRSGVRFAYAALVLFGMFYQALQDATAFRDPVIATVYGLGVLAIGFFFTPTTSRWYRDHKSLKR